MLSLPPGDLPAPVEAALASYFSFTELQDRQPRPRLEVPVSAATASASSSAAPSLQHSMLSQQEREQLQGSLSNSTLRRKLFEGMPGRGEKASPCHISQSA